MEIDPSRMMAYAQIRLRSSAGRSRRWHGVGTALLVGAVTEVLLKGVAVELAMLPSMVSCAACYYRDGRYE